MENRIRPMEESDLAQVLSWRNHPDIRRFMYSTHEISPEEHAQWYQSVRQSSKHTVLIYERNQTPAGFVSLTRKTCAEVAHWGFYLAPQAEKGTGYQLGKTALTYAFNELNLHKVCGEALGFNSPSIRFHQKLGFKEEGLHKEQHFDGKAYHDVVSFGLLRAQWNNRKD